MIQLNQDALVFQMPGGDSIPCSAEMVTVQLIGDSNDGLDPEVIRNAAQAVLHYFKKRTRQTSRPDVQLAQVRYRELMRHK